MGIGILGIIGILPWALQGARDTEMYTTATMLAEMYMEQIMSDSDWLNLEVNYNDSYPTRRDIPGYSAYKANLKVVIRPGTSNLLKEITVTIFWYMHGHENSITIVNMRKRN